MTSLNPADGGLVDAVFGGDDALLASVIPDRGHIFVRQDSARVPTTAGDRVMHVVHRCSVAQVVDVHTRRVVTGVQYVQSGGAEMMFGNHSVGQSTTMTPTRLGNGDAAIATDVRTDEDEAIAINDRSSEHSFVGIHGARVCQ